MYAGNHWQQARDYLAWKIQLQDRRSLQGLQIVLVLLIKRLLRVLPAVTRLQETIGTSEMLLLKACRFLGRSRNVLEEVMVHYSSSGAACAELSATCVCTDRRYG